MTINNKICTLPKKIGLEEEVYQLLQDYKLTVTTAESCTGGLLAGRLINVPGISDYFMEGYITYSNEAKERILGVLHETLELFGAVSKQTALEMARGCMCAAGTDIGIGITGIAGPGGGSEQKPVGLVYIGCCYKDRAYVEKCFFEGNRNEVRESSVEKALMILRDIIRNEVGL